MNEREGRRHDPRRLSRSKPGRSEIQDDPPTLPPALPSNDNRETVGDYRRTQGIKHPAPSPLTLRKRELRRRGAMPPGSGDTPGSRS
jgi:hypothetical protein